MGRGPGTGWGLGPCGGGMANGRRGTGRGQGLGWRRFWGNSSATSPSKKEEAEVLEEELKAIKARLAQLKDQQ